MFETVTNLYAEMEICSEFIGCWHHEFDSQNADEKLKWYFYREMKIKRDKYFADKRQKDLEADAKKNRVIT